MKNTAEKLGNGIIAFSPLAQGMLTDRYLNGIPCDSRVKKDGRFLKENALTKERIMQIEQLNALAEERGQSLARWHWHGTERSFRNKCVNRSFQAITDS